MVQKLYTTFHTIFENFNNGLFNYPTGQPDKWCTLRVQTQLPLSSKLNAQVSKQLNAPDGVCMLLNFTPTYSLLPPPNNEDKGILLESLFW